MRTTLQSRGGRETRRTAVRKRLAPSGVASAHPYLKGTLLLLALTFALLGGWPTQAQFIWINLSYKVVLNPADGTRPPGATDAGIDQAIVRMNDLLASYQRSFRMRRVDPITEVGGAGDTTGPSKWYNVDFLGSDTTGTQHDQMESEAINDGRYRRNSSAINFYVLGGFDGGVCSFYHLNGVSPEDYIVVIGRTSASDGDVQLHELGHFFKLCHTQGCECGFCGSAGDCLLPEDDRVSDTLLDFGCWGEDEISRLNFTGRTYAELSSNAKGQVDNVFFNLMSYHAYYQGVTTDRLTEKQLDRWTDSANDDRRFVASGRTWAVDPRGTCAVRHGGSDCTGLDGPFNTVTEAINSANPNGGDIIMIRPSSYNERGLRIDKPLTLRVTRQGSATIGR